MLLISTWTISLRVKLSAEEPIEGMIGLPGHLTLNHWTFFSEVLKIQGILTKTKGFK